MSVKIPRNPEDLLELAGLVYAKHTTDGAASPLNSLADYNWTDNGAKIAQAQTLQDKRNKWRKTLKNCITRETCCYRRLILP